MHLPEVKTCMCRGILCRTGWFSLCLLLFVRVDSPLAPLFTGDETYQDIFQDYTQMASNHPDMLNRSQPYDSPRQWEGESGENRRSWGDRTGAPSSRNLWNLQRAVLLAIGVPIGWTLGGLPMYLDTLNKLFCICFSRTSGCFLWEDRLKSVHFSETSIV